MSTSELASLAFGILLVTALCGLALAQFRYDVQALGTSDARYLKRDRWTGDIWICAGSGCVELSERVIRSLKHSAAPP